MSATPARLAADMRFQAAPRVVDIKATADAALARADAVVRHWLPEGKRHGPEWIARNPTRDDHTPGSFSINLDTGAWSDFATGDAGGDLVALVAYLERSSQLDAARGLAEWMGTAPVSTRTSVKSGVTEVTGVTALNDKPFPGNPGEKSGVTGVTGARVIPPEALASRPQAHSRHGKPTSEWIYRDARGEPLCVVYRFDPPDGRKQFAPLTWDGARWQWKAPAEPRPLYGLDRLAARPDAPVVLAEGEKAADAAQDLLPECVCIASMNGASSPKKADWSPVKGRHVRIWPDADKPGAQYARTAAALAYAAGALSVEILDLSALADNLPAGWDAADALADGWTAERLDKRARWLATPNPYADDQDQDQARPTPPDGWRLTKHMVFEAKPKDTGPDEYVPVCAPLWVIGRSTGPHGEWGLVIEFQDHDSQTHRFALPASRLHEDAPILARELALMGLRIIPGKEKRLLAYLDAWTLERRIPSAKRLGWQDHPSGTLQYVMPDRVICADGASSEIIYQPDRHSPTTRTVHQSGTLDDWRALVATPAAAHASMLFALAAGFGPAFLAFAEASDSFIVHLWGTTSRGKTTLAQIASSPWGCAADPNDAPSLSFIRRWNLTGNGLEGLAEAHSDLPLVLDELGASTASDIRPMVYSLAGGQGKTAMTAARELREPRAWRTIGISTGEGSLHARMSDAGSVKGGLTHRALDVEVSDIASETSAERRGVVVEGIKAACARHYGTAGPAMVERIAREFRTAAAARAHVKREVTAILDEMTIPGLATETERALKRFALICAAGEYAARSGLIPCTPAAVRAAVRATARGWLDVNADTDDARIIASVRAFIHRHAARFQSVNDTARVVQDRAGYVDHVAREWMFTPDGLREAAPDHDITTTARALKAAGCLRADKDNRLAARVTVDGHRPRLYVVTATLMDEDERSLEVAL